MLISISAQLAQSRTRCSSESRQSSVCAEHLLTISTGTWTEPARNCEHVICKSVPVVSAKVRRYLLSRASQSVAMLRCVTVVYCQKVSALKLRRNYRSTGVRARTANERAGLYWHVIEPQTVVLTSLYIPSHLYQRSILHRLDKQVHLGLLAAAIYLYSSIEFHHTTFATLLPEFLLKTPRAHCLPLWKRRKRQW